MFFKLSGKVRIYTCFLTVLLFGGCQQQLQPQRSKQGMVVSAHSLASAAGLRVLQEGGNAVDAAAATALAISVVEPFSAGIGGGGFLLLRRAETGTVQALDFRERAPKRAG
ncbi:gamma-glutamyltransferase, partial [Microcoleus sp. herbarium8]|uniref:gamma-glutamyltransferase n=1 Tax=Microcoleus sp. herbarium8 TaxID=3055436 RepID=UPI002FD34136